MEHRLSLLHKRFGRYAVINEGVQRKPDIGCQASLKFTMKIYWLAVFILAIAAWSCKKEGQAEKQFKSQITGQWELEVYSCGECPVPFTSYPQGSGNIIAFTKDGQFIRKLKDSIIFSGRYAIVTDKECNQSGNLALQTNETTNGPVSFITIENLKLHLSTPDCYSDGATSIYRRVK